jgi:hypothetical protein
MIELLESNKQFVQVGVGFRLLKLDRHIYIVSRFIYMRLSE